MLNNVLTKLAATTASVALGWAVMEGNPVQAATVTYDFDVEVKSGLFAGNTYSGFFSYDDSSITGVDIEGVRVKELEFEFLSFIFTDEDEVQYPDFPQVIFFNGTWQGLDYAVNDKEIAPNTLLSFFISRNFGEYYQTPSQTIFPDDISTEGAMTVTYTLREESPIPPPSSDEGSPTPIPPSSGQSPISVPEPASIAGLSLLSMSLFLKKKASSQQAKETAKV